VRRSILAIATAMVGAGLWCAAQSVDVAGVILEFHGKWTIDNRDVIPKQKVVGGMTIRNVSGGQHDRIKIVYFDGQTVTCPSADQPTCSSLAVRSLATAAAPWRDRWMSVLASVFDNSPRLVAAMSRSNAQPDQIAAWSKDSLVFRQAGPVPERGLWRISALDSNGAVLAEPKPVDVSYAGSGSLRAALKPGLYQVDVLDMTSRRPTGSSFWLLAIADPAEVRAKLLELTELTKSWPDEEEATRMELMRSLLLSYRPRGN